MSHEPWHSELNPSEADCTTVEPASAVADGSEETVFDWEDVRDYDLGEGD
jgi:hypothetical protein